MFTKILMPSDGSDYALRAAEYGADIAKKYEAEVTLLYVAEMLPVLGMQSDQETHNKMRVDLQEHGTEALRKTAEVFERAGVHPHQELLFGSAVPIIIQYAREGAFDLLVMGSRGAGSTAIDQILIGSVAEGILHGAPCPILMVRPRQS